MHDLGKLPHPKTRAAIFWILFLAWPAMRVTRHVWGPEWLSLAEDAGAVLTALAVLTGKYMFQNTQRDVCERLNGVERKVEGYDEAWELLAPLSDLSK